MAFRNVLFFFILFLARGQVASEKHEIPHDPITVLIVGGKEANPRDWPFLVSVVRCGENNPNCGGSILDKRHILTAAHCFFYWNQDEKDITIEDRGVPRPACVNAAVHNITFNEPYTQHFNLEKVILHEKYDHSYLLNDIAVLKLNHDIDLSTWRAKPIRLNNDSACPVTAQQCKTAGWGRTRLNNQTNSEVTMEVSLPIVPNKECAEDYPDMKVLPSMLCAGYKEGEKSACKGDSGGPFVCECNGELVHVGIVSWGDPHCDLPNHPNVFTRTSSYIDWIKSKINND